MVYTLIIHNGFSEVSQRCPFRYALRLNRLNFASSSTPTFYKVESTFLKSHTVSRLKPRLPQWYIKPNKTVRCESSTPSPGHDHNHDLQPYQHPNPNLSRTSPPHQLALPKPIEVQISNNPRPRPRRNKRTQTIQLRDLIPKSRLHMRRLRLSLQWRDVRTPSRTGRLEDAARRLEIGHCLHTTIGRC